MKQHHDMDNWMKEKLKGHPSVLPEGGWSGLEESRRKKKRPVFFWWLSGFGAAAAIFLALWVWIQPGVPVLRQDGELTKGQEQPREEKRETAAQENDQVEPMASSQLAPERKALAIGGEPSIAQQSMGDSPLDGKTDAEDKTRPARRKYFYRKPFLTAWKIAPKDIVLGHLPLASKPEFLPVDSAYPVIRVKESTFQSPRLVLSAVYGLGAMRPTQFGSNKETAGLSNPQPGEMDYDRSIQESNFILHHYTLGIGLNWRGKQWTLGSELQLTHHRVQSRYNLYYYDGNVNSGTGTGTGGGVVINSLSSSNISEFANADPFRYWDVSLPVLAQYHFAQGIYLGGGIAPQVNFGSAGNWLAREPQTNLNIESLNEGMPIPLFNLGIQGALGWRFRNSMSLEYQMKFWAREQLDFEGYQYRARAHQIKLKITL